MSRADPFFSNVEIRKEWNSIDLAIIIEYKKKRWVVAVESKIRVLNTVSNLNVVGEL